MATVLLGEDDVLVPLALAQHLRDCGYNVLAVNTTDEALAVLKSTDVEVDVLRPLTTREPAARTSTG
jgi:CheY-like chemotaxis protein